MSTVPLEAAFLLPIHRSFLPPQVLESVMAVRKSQAGLKQGSRLKTGPSPLRLCNPCPRSFLPPQVLESVMAVRKSQGRDASTADLSLSEVLQASRSVLYDNIPGLQIRL